MHWLDLSRPWARLTDHNEGQTHMDIGYTGNHPALQTFVSPGVRLDVRSQALTGTICRAALDLSQVVEGTAVVLQTGWAQYFGDPRYDASPDIEYDLIDALIDRGATLLLVDSPGLYGGARSERHTTMDLHVVDCGAIAVENLCHVDDLPTTFTLYCFPLNVTEPNWLPARVVASW